jgi:hypothetical protein
MNKSKILVIIVLAAVSVLLIAATPAASDLVSLVIENNSKDYVTLKLNGPAYYYLLVPPDTTTTYTIARGDYDEQLFYSCGNFVNTTIDFTKKQIIVVPSCGEKAFNTPESLNPVIDAGRILKLVKVTFENPYTYDLLLILTGPATHVFTIEAGNSESYTIIQGDYDVVQYGCSYMKEWTFYPYANKVKELSCPTY